MRRITGNKTIDKNCGFALEYLCGTPTSSTGAGERWYTGIENGKKVLVHHTNGTPANHSTTTIYTSQEVSQEFSWELKNVPAVDPVKKWIEREIMG